MHEKSNKSPNLPSGYESSESLNRDVRIDGDTLPWLSEPYNVSLSRCTLQTGETFLIASVIGTNPKLIEAANGMNEGQQRNTDNMLYSRIPTFLSQGYSPAVETMPDPITNFPIGVMRNKGGQRVYFARIRLGVPEEDISGPTIIKLAVCDKNKQAKVMSALSGMSTRQMNQKLTK
jgi:hypothetical protein